MSVGTADDQVVAGESLGIDIEHRGGDGLDHDLWADPRSSGSEHLDLSATNIGRCRSDEAAKVTWLDDVRIDEYESPDAEVRELQDQMRAGSAGPYDDD